MGIFGKPKVIEPIMVRIEPGEFLMGSPPEAGQVVERPQHWVRINYDFEVGKYPVTFREWDAAAKLGACDGYFPYDERFGRAMRPVINVSWDNAQDYIRFLNEKTGKQYRLLSESEWEYCCRAGTQTAYSFGDEINRRQANFNYWQTVPVTRFPANQFGLVGMHGNIWEMCEDCWHRTYKEAPNDGRAWMEDNGGDCSQSLQRGGTWSLTADFLRSAYRFSFDRDDQFIWAGFRLARTLSR